MVRKPFRATADACLLLGTDADVDDGSAACLSLRTDGRRDNLCVLRRRVPDAEFIEDRLPSTGVSTGASIPADRFGRCLVAGSER